MATDVEALVLRIEASATKLEKDMAKANGIFDRGARRMESQAKQVGSRIGGQLGSRLTATFSAGVSRLGVIIGGALAFDKFLDASQIFVRLSNSLKVAGLSGQELTNTYEQLFKVAQENGTPIETLVALYSKGAQAQQNLGATSEQLIAFSTAVAQALRVQGGSAAESAGALTQLGQVLGGSVVQAEEYNSLIDGAYPLLQAAAAGMREAGGEVSKLTALVKSGKVSAKAFFDAILAGAPLLGEKLAGAEETVAQASTRMYNSFVNAVGKMDEAAGVSGHTTQIMDDISAALDRNAEAWAQWASTAVKYIEMVTKAGTMGLPTPDYQPQKKDSLGTLVGKMGGQALGTSKGDLGGSSSPDRIGLAFDLVDQTGKTSTPEALVGALKTSAQKAAAKIGPAVVPITLADYPVPKTGGSKGGPKENAYERELKQVRERTAETAAMIPLIGQEAYAIDQARVAEQLKNAATEAGLKLTPDRLAEIEQVSAAYGEQARVYDELQQKQDELRQSQQVFADTAMDAISGLIFEGESLGDTFSSIAKSIAKAALQATLFGQGPLANLFGVGGKDGGLGGILGALFKGFDAGGYTGAGGKFQPAGIVHAGEYVFDQSSVRAAGGPRVLDAMRRGLRGYANGGYVSGSAPSLPAMLGRQAGPSITYAPVIDARGADVAAVARLQRAMQQNQKDFATNVIAVQRKMQLRRTV